jgi:ankyrin repeat protein
VKRLAATTPETAGAVVAEGGRVLAEFAANGNAAGVRHLLDLGIPADARWAEGDGYWDLAPGSTALHAAAWRMEHAVVELLLARGAFPDARDDRGRTPLALAVKACVDSYWAEYRAPDSVRLLLAAGASVEGIPIPSGYDDVDRLLTAGAGQS